MLDIDIKVMCFSFVHSSFSLTQPLIPLTTSTTEYLNTQADIHEYKNTRILKGKEGL